MRKSALFVINTPAQVHTWKYVIRELAALGFLVKVLGRDYGQTLHLLDSYGIEHGSFGVPRSKYLKNMGILAHLWHGLRLAGTHRPSWIIGFGVDAALLRSMLRCHSVVFTDDDLLHFENRIIRNCSDFVLTPQCFREDMGKNHLRLPTYKELAYLHPDRFRADPGILHELGLSGGVDYVLVRFNRFDAGHDVGAHGFSIQQKIRLVDELRKRAVVFVSPEGELSRELEPYRLPVAAERIHHVLYYAKLLVTDTQTMTTEAAVLGTPVVRSNSWVGPNDMGNFVELENRYHLVFSVREPEQAITKAVDLAMSVSLKEEAAESRRRLLDDKIDLTRYVADLVANYPRPVSKSLAESGGQI